MATLWPHEYAGRFAARTPGRDDHHADDRDLLGLATVIDVPSSLTQAERRRAEAPAGRDHVNEAVAILRPRAEAADRLVRLLIEDGRLDDAIAVLRDRADAGEQEAASRRLDLLAEHGRADDLRAEMHAGTRGAAAEPAEPASISVRPRAARTPMIVDAVSLYR